MSAAVVVAGWLALGGDRVEVGGDENHPSWALLKHMKRTTFSTCTGEGARANDREERTMESHLCYR